MAEEGEPSELIDIGEITAGVLQLEIKRDCPLLGNASDKIITTINSLYGRNLNMIGNIENVSIEQDVKFAVKESLKALDSSCINCTGNHDMWVIAGGYATYKMGHTNKYTDVDIFVFCNGENRSIASSSCYKFENVYNFVFGRVVTQVIQVFFDCKLKDSPGLMFIDFMAMFVLSTFDLPLCKVAMHFPLDLDQNAYVIDMSAIDFYNNPPADRSNKYKERQVPNDVKKVPSLKILAVNSIFKIK